MRSRYLKEPSKQIMTTIKRNSKNRGGTVLTLATFDVIKISIKAIMITGSRDVDSRAGARVVRAAPVAIYFSR
jgi:hypothetical protein